MEPNVLTRLKRVAGKQTTTLTHYGRKSGKPYAVTIWFVPDGEKVYLGTANVNRQWVRNVQETPQVRLSIGGEVFNGAHVSSPPVPSMSVPWPRFDGSTGCFDRSLKSGAF